MVNQYLKDNGPRVPILHNQAPDHFSHLNSTCRGPASSFLNMICCFLSLFISLSLLRMPFSSLSSSQLILTLQDNIKWNFLWRVFLGIPPKLGGVRCFIFKFPKYSGHKSIIALTQMQYNCKFTCLSLRLILHFLKKGTHFHL